MKCPACKQPLVVVERTGIEVDWCPSCGGLWFDEDELELLAEAAGRSSEFTFLEDFATLPPGAKSNKRKCPRCDARLQLKTFDIEELVQVDVCPAGHGIWLDKGELGTLFRAMPRSHEQVSNDEQSEKWLLSFLGEVFGMDAKESQGAESRNEAINSRTETE